jgi:hypothetical protein
MIAHTGYRYSLTTINNKGRNVFGDKIYFLFTLISNDTLVFELTICIMYSSYCKEVYTD